MFPQTTQPGLPPLWNARRGIVCTALILIGIAQTLGTIALSTSSAALLTGEAHVYGIPVLPALGVAALVALGAFVIQNRAAEHFALSYVHDVRMAYARHALLLPFDGKSPPIGLSLTRLVNDLGAIKLWLSKGLLALVTLAATLATLTAWIVFLEIGFLLPLAVCVSVWFLGLALALRPLRKSIRQSRQRRGGIAILLGKALPDRLPLLLHGKLSPLLTRLGGKSVEVCRLLVTRATWSGVIRAISRATFPCAVLLYAVAGIADAASIALFLLIFAFLSSQLEAGASGLEYYEANKVAHEKLRKVFEINAMSPIGKPSGQSPDWSTPVTIDALQLPSGNLFSARIEPGNSNLLQIASFEDRRHLALSLCGLTQVQSQKQIQVGGLTFADLGRKELWRRVALVSPVNGIPAYQARRPAAFLGARVDLPEKDLGEFDTILDFDADRVPAEAQKIPEIEQFRIRVARALLRDPRMLILQDDGIHNDDRLEAGLATYLKSRDVTLVVIAARPTE
ncbi:hypothetical protein [uncultured Roseibium sp.]|uniref:hypothetical protein n=1 Tax=uncultured Roseibium sp. TaxID=1936171 RepID=UPI00263289A2|nr:hypothetical protein [uncultured Roseibium sp.]